MAPELPKIVPSFHLAAAFVADLSARFDLGKPDWSVTMIPEDMKGAGIIIYQAKVEPKGQIAAIVRELKVKVKVYPEAAKGFFHAEISYDYRHRGGGSNGNATHLLISYLHSFDGVEQEYDGFVDLGVFDRLNSSIRSFNRQLEDKS